MDCHNRVVGVQFGGLLVGFPCFVEHAFMLVGNREIVERRGVARIDLSSLLPAIDRLAPEAALRDVDPEFHLRLRVATCVRGGRR